MKGEGFQDSLFMDDNFSSLQIYTERTLTPVTPFIKTEEGAIKLWAQVEQKECYV
jgi:hypothetical protein